jgi:hypothetical protein
VASGSIRHKYIESKRIREASAIVVKAIRLKLKAIKAGVYIVLRVRLLVSSRDNLDINNLT